MKKIMLFILSPFVLIYSALGQNETKKDNVEGPWKVDGSGALNFSQLSFTNWAAGGENSISGNFTGNIKFKYKNGNNQWKNNLDVAYGLMKQGENKIIKTDDKLHLNSKYGRKSFMNNENWYYSVLFSFKTQFDKGYDSPGDSNKISDFMAPAYLMLSMGMNYDPNDEFSLSLSPVTGKTTIVNAPMLSEKGAFGVEPGNLARYEYGGSMDMNYKKEIWENVNLKTELKLFSNYFHNPQNIDINWNMELKLKVNKYLSATLNTTLIYDDDVDIEVDEDGDGKVDAVGPRTQFKEAFGIGLSYEF